MKFLQAKLNRSRTAQNLLAQIRLEKNADIVIISQQYRDEAGTGWYHDEVGTTVIWILDPQRQPVAQHGSGEGFASGRTNDISIISCYLTPNESIGDFQAKLDSLDDMLRDVGGELIVAIPRNRACGGRRPAYWWTNEIAELRKKCLKLRRTVQRGRKSDRDFALRSFIYRTAKKALGRAIKTSKCRCCDKLRDDLNSDPWGLGYKIVM